LMVRMREEGDRWILEHLLVTLQQQEGAVFMELCHAIAQTVRHAYDELQAFDSRWYARWEDIELMVNPNGPMVDAGSDGDNGQTGRKLAVDFYGPRVPIGGGALSGKHMSHIDRIGAYAAREAAVRAVLSGAKECLVRLAWAPNVPLPLDVTYQMEGRGRRESPEYFHHDLLRERFDPSVISRRLGSGTHFWDPLLPWNQVIS
jgi:S-adenosylmethionine synthetase